MKKDFSIILKRKFFFDFIFNHKFIEIKQKFHSLKKIYFYKDLFLTNFFFKIKKLKKYFVKKKIKKKK